MAADSATTELGIKLHEEGGLERAVRCFEESSRRDGGCSAGMLLYGCASELASDRFREADHALFAFADSRSDMVGCGA